MKLGTLLLELQKTEHKVAVYEDLVAYLGQEGLEVPVESGTVSEEVLEEVRVELRARRAELIDFLGAAEDVEVEDAELAGLRGAAD